MNVHLRFVQFVVYSCAAKVKPIGDGGIEQKGKRTHGHGQQCGCVGVREEGVRGVNGNGKNTMKNFVKEIL